VTWEIVLGLAELVALIAMFVTWATKRAKTDADTAAALRELASALKEFKSQSNEAHKEMWVAIDENTHEIARHEKWIVRHDARKGIVEEDLK
jgi:histone H3/H4